MRTFALAAFVGLGLVGLGCEEPTASEELDATARPASQVELKVTIREDQLDQAYEVLALDDAAAEERDVYFYDTPDLELYQSGVILRARKVKGGDDDVTVKIKPLESKQVKSSYFKISGFKCEIDRVGESSTSACSLKVDVDGGDIDEVADGSRSIKKLFDEDQEEFLEEYGFEIPWDDLVPLGPAEAEVWTVDPEGLGLELDVEVWWLPERAPILELSTKVKKSSAGSAAAAVAEFLEEAGLDPSNEQETKTQAALETFSADY